MALLASKLASFASVYRDTVRTVRAQSDSGLPGTSSGRPFGRPDVESRLTRVGYCFFDTEIAVMSMIPSSKSSAVSVTPCTYGFKRYFVAE